MTAWGSLAIPSQGNEKISWCYHLAPTQGMMGQIASAKLVLMMWPPSRNSTEQPVLSRMIVPTNFTSNRTCRNGKPLSPQAVITAVRHMSLPSNHLSGSRGGADNIQPHCPCWRDHLLLQWQQRWQREGLGNNYAITWLKDGFVLGHDIGGKHIPAKMA